MEVIDGVNVDGTKIPVQYGHIVHATKVATLNDDYGALLILDVTGMTTVQTIDLWNQSDNTAAYQLWGTKDYNIGLDQFINDITVNAEPRTNGHKRIASTTLAGATATDESWATPYKYVALIGKNNSGGSVAILNISYAGS